MSDIVISVENLGKKYSIRHQEARQRYSTLRDVLADQTKMAAHRLWSILRSPNSHVPSPTPIREDFWALKDVSFEVKQGETLGIIGRNGAGKSTLLRILSRVAAPTTGRARVRGRVSTLLEVGTGFHPELTGRENTFLNGAILGMSRREVLQRFDAIVAFAEVERFLDTPVKRYSSGMYVRLAFAVAAHLEPDILIVDEVLAVGDAEFQAKCTQRMSALSSGGRTIIFVSHNMQAIRNLCTQAILLETGQVAAAGSVSAILSKRSTQVGFATLSRTWAELDAPGNDEVRLLEIAVSNAGMGSDNPLRTDENLLVRMKLRVGGRCPALCVGFDLSTQDGTPVLRSYQTDMASDEWPTLDRGVCTLQCTVPKHWLNEGRYCISPRIGVHNKYWIVHIDQVLCFTTRLSHGTSPLWDMSGGGKRPGIIAPILSWSRA